MTQPILDNKSMKYDFKKGQYGSEKEKGLQYKFKKKKHFIVGNKHKC